MTLITFETGQERGDKLLITRVRVPKTVDEFVLLIATSLGFCSGSGVVPLTKPPPRGPEGSTGGF